MNKIICISRDYGSGGRAIGECLAKSLNYKFFDSKLVDLAAEKGMMSKDQVKLNDETAVNPWLYTPLYTGVYSEFMSNSGPERLFNLQSEIIKEQASKYNCIFVGRSADVVLENEDVDLVSLYIYAPAEWRMNRLIKTENYQSERDALVAMHKKDKQRKNYYNYYTGREYGNPVNYDLCVNSSVLGIKKSADFIEDFLKLKFN